MEFIDLPPLLSTKGSVRLPGSKSISNRVLLLAALAEGETEVRDLLESDDTARMLEALASLGVGVQSLDGNAFRIRGAGGAFPVKKAELFLGNAGTAFRSLTAALALSGGHYTLSGVPRMHERPIGDLSMPCANSAPTLTILATKAFRRSKFGRRPFSRAGSSMFAATFQASF